MKKQRNYLFFCALTVIFVHSSADLNATASPESVTEFARIVSSIASEAEPNRFSRNQATTSKDADFSTTVPSVTETTTPGLLQKWQKFEKITRVFAKNSIKNLMASLIENSGNLNISSSCRRDVLRLLIGLRDIKTWAFSFVDASGKLIDGLLSGTMSSLGEYDQCLDIQATDDRRGKGKVLFTGQYCALDVRPPMPQKPKSYKFNEVVEELRNFSKGGNLVNEAAKTVHLFHFLAMRFGICVPSGCQASDIQQVANSLTKEIYWNATVKRCELRQENVYTPLIISVMTAMCFFGFLMLIGSLIDLCHYYQQKKVKNIYLQILISFSLMHNFKRLVNTDSSSGKLSCLHGVRFLSMSWVILGHTCLNINFQLFRALKKLELLQRDIAFQAVINASVAVDSFFFISGLLVCYATIKVIRQTKKPFNIPMYIVHRLFRIYPVYIMVIVFMYLAPILGSGPVYHDTTEVFVDACYKNWWTNLLFVNNFVNADHICLPQSWYIACDMQLYFAALIILIPILRWPKIGLGLSVLAILASIAGSGWMTYINEYPPTMLFIHPDPEQRIFYWANAYFKPYSHAGPYCLGIIIGYILATKDNLKMNLVVRIVGWGCAITCNMCVLYGVYEWNKGHDPNLIETLLYSSFHRIGWAVGVAWVVVNCVSGQGGIVNYILSWKCWVPLGRLTYTAYLIHPIVQVAAVGNLRMNLQTEPYFIVWMFCGHLMMTYGAAFATSMLVEAPFFSLEKLLLRRIAPKSKTNNTNNEPDQNRNGVYSNGNKNISRL